MRSPRNPFRRPSRGRWGPSRPAGAGPALLLATATLGLAGCGASGPESVGATAETTTRAVGATTSTGPTTTGRDGERTTPEGMVLPEYADGRAPTAADDAPCTTAAMERAVVADIDRPDRPPSYLDCADRYAVAVVAFGSCPPVDGQADGDPPRCANRKVTYWKAVGGRWRILTYLPEDDADCDVPRGVGEPHFPRSLCVPG